MRYYVNVCKYFEFCLKTREDEYSYQYRYLEFKHSQEQKESGMNNVYS